MVATRGRTFKRPWRRSCLSSKLKSSSAPIGRKDSWCFHAVGSSNAPLLGSTAAEGSPRIGRTSIATRWRSCGLPQSASCSENFVIPPDVFGQTLTHQAQAVRPARQHTGGHRLLSGGRFRGVRVLGISTGLGRWNLDRCDQCCDFGWQRPEGTRAALAQLLGEDHGSDHAVAANERAAGGLPTLGKCDDGNYIWPTRLFHAVSAADLVSIR